jgi:hypothetical protein
MNAERTSDLASLWPHLQHDFVKQITNKLPNRMIPYAG